VSYKKHAPCATDLKIEQIDIDQLTPSRNNPRTHSKKQIRQIAASIEAFGFTNPILIDAGNLILAGHGRLEAARFLNLSTVPVIRLHQMTEAQKRAYILADNKLAENAGWNNDLLAIELQYLSEIDLDFDVLLTGFETGEIDFIIEGLNDGSGDEAEELPEVPTGGPAVSCLGDLWVLGQHRLLCGDALDPINYEKLLGKEKAAMIFTDPPYNVPINGHVSGLGKVMHEEFSMASGEMNVREFTDFLTKVFVNQAAACSDGAISFVCIDWGHVFELLTAGREVYEELKNICIWVKTNGGMGSLYRSQHEFVAVFKKGTAPHVNNVQLGKNGRNRTNIWCYQGMNSFGADRDRDLAMHPTVKPVPLIEDAIKDCSNRGDVILDPFMGSGSTLIAAELAGRRAFGIELDSRYVDVILERFRSKFGIDPVHLKSGLTYSELS
jgi:DNA modification methylase